MPLLSLYDHKIGFYGYPKSNPSRRVSVQSEDNYIQARATATMAATFSSYFFTISGQSEMKQLVFASVFLMVDPNYIYELLALTADHSLQNILKNLDAYPLNPQTMGSAQALQLIAEFLDAVEPVITAEAQKMRNSLADNQKLEQMRIKLVNDTARLYIVLSQQTSALLRMTEIMGNAYSAAGIETTMDETSRLEREQMPGHAADFLVTYRKSLQEVYDSRSYRDAYRFDLPMTQLNPEAL